MPPVPGPEGAVLVCVDGKPGGVACGEEAGGTLGPDGFTVEMPPVPGPVVGAAAPDAVDTSGSEMAWSRPTA